MTVCPSCGMPTSRAYPCECALECSECGERGGVAWEEHEAAWLCERCAELAESLRDGERDAAKDDPFAGLYTPEELERRAEDEKHAAEHRAKWAGVPRR